MGLYGSNESTLDLEKFANQSYPAALEIIFYFGFIFSYCLCCQIALYIHGYHIPTPQESTLRYMYAFSWNLIKY